MEDASKEFQIFLSPTRDFFQQPNRGESAAPSKHRIVPVISKILSSSSSSTFTLNQRRSSVYKAVSGVSFQDTDVPSKKSVSKKERRSDKKRERRQSYATTPDNEKKKHSILPPAPGARRSRSLTSMESGLSVSTDLSKNPPEITHPFAPVILYNQSSGRKSRYSRVKERRRSSSQARNVGGVDFKKHEGSGTNSSHKSEPHYQPVRPRRTRSASRTRKPSTLASFSSENNLDLPSDGDELFHLRCEKHFDNKITAKEVENTMETKQNITDIVSMTAKQLPHQQEALSNSTIITSSGDIDFSVNDTDWKKYDALVTQKLDTLLKKKEEPEGGYFSLEREEAEELERFSDIGDHFQRDNCNESIYVAQVVTKDVKESDLPQYEQYTVEEIYSEVPFSNQGREVGFVDDEGLYEEIFFDRGNEHIDANYNNKNFSNPPPVNILVSPSEELVQTVAPKTFLSNEKPKIEKSSSTTIVYIGGDLSKTEKTSFAPSTKSDNSLKQSASCNNLLFNSNVFRQSKDKRMSVVDIMNSSCPSEDKGRTNNLPWCGCYSRPNQTVNHTSSCIQSRSGLLSTKCTLLGKDNHDDDSTHLGAQASNESSSTSFFHSKNINTGPNFPQEKSLSSHAPFSNIPEPDYELSDIDLDMFTPKTYSNENDYRKNMRSVSETHLNRLFKPTSSFPETGARNEVGRGEQKQEENIISPKTFRGFLEDSIFNPPDTESLAGDAEGLVIRDDQVVTCITDSSSSSDESEESSDDEAALSSPWLEAQNEFEYVAFKEDKNRLSKFVKRRKPRKVISIPRIFGSSPTAVDSERSSGSSHHGNRGRTDLAETPKRPTRRRKTSETNKLGEPN